MKKEKSKILLVDDEKINLFAVQSLLRRDYEVYVAHNAVAALEILKDQCVDIVISDQLMPTMSGVAFLDCVKQEYPDVKRYILTAYNDNEELRKGLADQVVEHIFEKPFRKDELKKMAAVR